MPAFLHLKQGPNHLHELLVVAPSYQEVIHELEDPGEALDDLVSGLQPAVTEEPVPHYGIAEVVAHHVRQKCCLVHGALCHIYLEVGCQGVHGDPHHTLGPQSDLISCWKDLRLVSYC